MKHIYTHQILKKVLMLLGIAAITVISCNKTENPIKPELINEMNSINYLTENYPPLNYEEDGNLYGVSVDILDALFEKMDVNISRKNVVIKNWSEAYQQTLNQEKTMLFSTARLPERELLFKWVGPIAPEKTIIVGLTAENLVISTPTDLNNYSVGAIRDYAAILILSEQGVLSENIVQYDNVEQMYQALKNGAVDCIVYSETGNTLIIQSLGYNLSDFKTLFMVKVVENYFAFNINTSDQLIELFQQNLEQLKLDKTEDGSSVYEKILSNYQIIQHVDDNITPDMAISLVDQTCSDIEQNAQSTFEKINQQLAPYKNQTNPALYVFVYDTAINMMAHADNILLVGHNFRGKTDAAGKKFRDEIVAGALAHQNGWTDYIYTKSDQSGLYYKTTYYQLVTGNDGHFYIVCAGRFK